ncbi:uncharacterized protein DUF4386 [Desulfitobacterium sp. LBE]|nr:DUF4386 domain-containing protein [Desulfitobacterium sp. LBE]MEA5025755.1 DUF4386 domain-containing protein [Desulfitobacterium hafniense]TWH56346.1 uncharacterized protein DUF4386 [Desulfitobacterium sp. LBE]
MGNRIGFQSQNRTARIAGLLYSLMIPLAAFGVMYAPTSLVIEGNVEATIANVLANGHMFRLSILSALVVQVCHIFIVLFLYKLLKPVNRSIAGLMVIFMLTSVPIAMVNELNHYGVLFTIHNDVSVGGTLADQTKNMIVLFFQLRQYGIVIAGIFWGLWLLPMGYLVYKSNFLPKALGIVLIIASFFYVCDSFLSLGIPGYGETLSAAVMKIPLYGELLFPLWLLFKGIQPSFDTTQ